MHSHDNDNDNDNDNDGDKEKLGYDAPALVSVGSVSYKQYDEAKKKERVASQKTNK